MEYTKDMILKVNYGQDVKSQRKVFKLLDKMISAIGRHKIMTTVISITIMLMVLDFMLINSFIQILSNM